MSTDLSTRLVGELLKFRRGISWDATQERDQPEPGTWPVLAIPNVQRSLVLDKVTLLRVPGGRPDPNRVAGAGTILMVGSNGNPARVGNAVYIDEDVAGRGFLFASFLIGAQLKDEGAANAKFLFHYIASPHVQDEITGSVRGTTGLKNLSQRFLEGLRVPDFPLPEQRRIAEILDTVDEAIRKTEEICAKLKQVKQGLLHDLLTRGIDDAGELRDPDRHPEQFKDSSLGRIPKAWEVDTLGALTAEPVTYGIVQAGPHVPDGVPYIRTGDMSGDRLAIDGLLRTSRRIAASYQRSRVAAGEIVCAIRATVGKVLPVPPVLDGANLTQGTARIAPRSDINATFLLWAMRAASAQRQFDLAVKGTTFREITLGQLRLLRLPVPRPREQQAIADALTALAGRIERERVELDKLSLVKQGLMEALLTGRVRVTALLEEAAE